MRMCIHNARHDGTQVIDPLSLTARHEQRGVPKSYLYETYNQ